MKKDGKLDFSDVARFNYELDMNKRLRAGIDELDRHFTELTEKEYRTRMLALFAEEGIEMSLKELDMLLVLRMKTDQMLLKNKN